MKALNTMKIDQAVMQELNTQEMNQVAGGAISSLASPETTMLAPPETVMNKPC